MTVCVLCKSPVPEASPVRWIAPTGEVVHVAFDAIPVAAVDTSVGEMEICERCYLSGLPTWLTAGDLAEIHYQFGLEYLGRHDWQLSADALARARELRDNADAVAALAAAETGRGNVERAVALYRRALEMDPAHFMSRQNLRNLRQGS